MVGVRRSLYAAAVAALLAVTGCSGADEGPDRGAEASGPEVGAEVAGEGDGTPRTLPAGPVGSDGVSSERTGRVLAAGTHTFLGHRYRVEVHEVSRVTNDADGSVHVAPEGGVLAEFWIAPADAGDQEAARVLQEVQTAPLPGDGPRSTVTWRVDAGGATYEQTFMESHGERRGARPVEHVAPPPRTFSVADEEGASFSVVVDGRRYRLG